MDNKTLANALQALANMITSLQQNQAAIPAAPCSVYAAIFNPFESNQPFDLSTHLHPTAYPTACSALEESWDGSPDTFSSFIICLKSHASQVNGMQLPHMVS